MRTSWASGRYSSGFTSLATFSWGVSATTPTMVTHVPGGPSRPVPMRRPIGSWSPKTRRAREAFTTATRSARRGVARIERAPLHHRHPQRPEPFRGDETPGRVDLVVRGLLAALDPEAGADAAARQGQPLAQPGRHHSRQRAQAVFEAGGEEAQRGGVVAEAARQAQPGRVTPSARKPRGAAPASRGC